MAYSLIAHVGSGGSAHGVTSSDITTTGADLLVASVAYYFGIDNAPTFSDSKLNTWIPLTAAEGTQNVRAQFFYAHGSLSVGSGHTFALNGTSIYPSIYVTAWSGAKSSSPFDQQNGAGSGSASTIQPGSVTPSEDNELVITVNVHENGGATPTINGGFTVSDALQQSGGAYEGGGMAYLIQTSAAVANPTWNVTNSVIGLAAAIATFRQETGGGGSARGIPLGHDGTTFGGGRAFTGILR